MGGMHLLPMQYCSQLFIPICCLSCQYIIDLQFALKEIFHAFKHSESGTIMIKKELQVYRPFLTPAYVYGWTKGG